MPPNIQFDSDTSMSGYGAGNYGAYGNYGMDNQPKKGITGWLIRKGIVRSEKTGTFLLVVVALINFVLSAIVFFST